VAERLNAAVSKTVSGGFVRRGFESLPLRSQAGCAAPAALPAHRIGAARGAADRRTELDDASARRTNRPRLVARWADGAGGGRGTVESSAGRRLIGIGRLGDSEPPPPARFVVGRLVAGAWVAVADYPADQLRIETGWDETKIDPLERSVCGSSRAPGVS
jgi:hypothetical protein